MDLPQQDQAVVDRLVALCRDDPRVAAAYLGGSHARQTADRYSDLDLGVLTTDDAYAAVAAERAAFLRRLGSHYCSKTSTCPTWCSSSSPDGTDGELAFAPASDLRGLHAGPCRVLLDKQGILTEAACPWPVVARADQRETLRRLLHWFWHDLSHFITALGRGQLWWARAPE